jgi:hypothetical protein
VEREMEERIGAMKDETNINENLRRRDLKRTRKRKKGETT